MQSQINYNPNTQIALIWCVSDVQTVRPDLDDEEAFIVLTHVERKHDPDQGVNWDILKIWADDLYPTA